MSATVTKLRPDAFADLDGMTVREVLEARGWTGIEAKAGSCELAVQLGDVVAVVVTGNYRLGLLGWLALR